MRVPPWPGRIAAGIVLATLALGATLSFQLLHDKDAADLQICIEVERAPLAWICRQGLRFHRFNAGEIAEMNASAGLWHVAALADEALAKELLRRWRSPGQTSMHPAPACERAGRRCTSPPWSPGRRPCGCCCRQERASMRATPMARPRSTWPAKRNCAMLSATISK
jgi:hypothetical protein